MQRSSTEARVLYHAAGISCVVIATICLALVVYVRFWRPDLLARYTPSPQVAWHLFERDYFETYMAGDPSIDEGTREQLRRAGTIVKERFRTGDFGTAGIAHLGWLLDQRYDENAACGIPRFAHDYEFRQMMQWDAFEVLAHCHRFGQDLRPLVPILYRRVEDGDVHAALWLLERVDRQQGARAAVTLLCDAHRARRLAGDHTQRAWQLARNTLPPADLYPVIERAIDTPCRLLLDAIEALPPIEMPASVTTTLHSDPDPRRRLRALRCLVACQRPDGQRAALQQALGDTDVSVLACALRLSRRLDTAPSEVVVHRLLASSNSMVRYQALLCCQHFNLSITTAQRDRLLQDSDPDLRCLIDAGP